MSENIIFEYIKEDSKYYGQALELRFQALYENFSLPRSCVLDNKEPISLHLVGIMEKNVMAYGRLTEIEKNTFQITQVSVNENYRLRNLGKNLIELLVANAAENNAKKVVLDARMTAVDFYKKLNFVSIGDVFVSEKTHIPHIKMERILKG